MNLYDTHTMKRGAILVDVCGYTGEEDFYTMHKIIDEVIKPEDSGFSVDSMCIGGYFNKDGILVRTSSESPYDCCQRAPCPTPSIVILKPPAYTFKTCMPNHA